MSRHSIGQYPQGRLGRNRQQACGSCCCTIVRGRSRGKATACQPCARACVSGCAPRRTQSFRASTLHLQNSACPHLHAPAWPANTHAGTCTRTRKHAMRMHAPMRRGAQEWADSRISDLIKKACEADKPFAEELRTLREEARRLRADKDALETRCQEVGPLGVEGAGGPKEQAAQLPQPRVACCMLPVPIWPLVWGLLRDRAGNLMHQRTSCAAVPSPRASPREVWPPHAASRMPSVRPICVIQASCILS